MAEDYSISYSFSPSTGPAEEQASAGGDGELFAFSNCELVNLGTGGSLLLSRSNGRQMIVMPEVATAMTYCHSFRTLGDHARTLVDSIPQLEGQLDDVTNVLGAVKDGGLMLSASQVAARLQKPNSDVTELAPTRVCITTCDRPEAVERLLDSMLRGANLSRHDAIFLVDNSRDGENAARNRDLVVRFNLTSVSTIYYIGAKEQRELLASLANACPDHAASINFLADGSQWTAYQTFGLTRNLCLLLTVGFRCIMLDDDILCSTVESPYPGEGISFGGGDSRELACFGSMDELMQNARYRDIDPLQGHANCLGLTLAEALEHMGSNPLHTTSLQDANAALLDHLHADSPVLITQCGSWGDPGAVGNNWLLHLGKDSVERVLGSPGGLSRVVDNRYYWLGRTRPNIGKMAVMSQATGLDNTRLLPPYFPAFRGEDYLFASMVVYLHPESAVLDYDWCVPHLPLEKRGYDIADTSIAASGGLGLCARYLSDRTNYAADISKETRLGRLALDIMELGEQSQADLTVTFRRHLASRHAEQQRLLQNQLQIAPALADGDWQDFLQRGMQEVNQALQTPASPATISAAPENVDDSTLLTQIQSGMSSFGQAIAAWSDIRRAAANINRHYLDQLGDQ